MEDRTVQVFFEVLEAKGFRLIDPAAYILSSHATVTLIGQVLGLEHHIVADILIAMVLLNQNVILIRQRDFSYVLEFIRLRKEIVRFRFFN